MSIPVPYEGTKPFTPFTVLSPFDDKIFHLRILKALNNTNKPLADLKGNAKKLPSQLVSLNSEFAGRRESIDTNNLMKSF